MVVNNNVFVFDIKTGITIKVEDKKEAKDLINVKSINSIYKALNDDALLKGRFRVFAHRLKRTQKEALYLSYWTSRRSQGEKWAEGPDGLRVSNLGRVHNGERFLYPTLLNNRTVVVRKGKKLHNVTRLVCELFVIKRPLKKNEIAFRRGHYLEYNSEAVYVGTWDDYRTRGMRANSRDVALLNADGSIKECYMTIKEASQKNFISTGALSIALKKGRPCCGKMFRYMIDADYKL